MGQGGEGHPEQRISAGVHQRRGQGLGGEVEQRGAQGQGEDGGLGAREVRGRVQQGVLG